MSDDSEKYLKVGSFRLVRWLNINRFLVKTSQGAINLGDEVSMGNTIRETFRETV